MGGEFEKAVDEIMAMGLGNGDRNLVKKAL